MINQNPIIINEGALGSIGRVFKDDFRGLSKVPKATWRFIKPFGGKVKDPKTGKVIGHRANVFRRKVLKTAATNFSFYLPRMTIAAGVGAIKQYVFTSKEKLLVDLIEAYKQAETNGDKELADKIKKEIIKTEKTSERELKLKATIKGSLYGSLIGAAWGFGSTLKYAALGRHMRLSDQAAGAKIVKQKMPDGKIRSVLRYARDKNGKIIKNPDRVEHSKAMKELGDIIRGGRKTISASELTEKNRKIRHAVDLMQSTD